MIFSENYVVNEKVWKYVDPDMPQVTNMTHALCVLHN